MRRLCLLFPILACGGEPDTAMSSDAGSTGDTPSASTSAAETATADDPGSTAPEPDGSTSSDPTTTTPTTGPEPDSDALLIGFSIHLEGWMVTEAPVYENYTLAIRELALSAADAGAKLTFEAGDDLTRAVLANDDTLYGDLIDLGHAVEVHADLGYSPMLASLTQESFEADMIAFRNRAIEAGAQAEHVSGVCSHLDWLEATRVAGYAGIGGTVSYCWMAAPEADRPPQYADCTDPATCHDPWPETFQERLHPWRAADIATWAEHDPDGDLVIVPSATGLTCLEETQDEFMPGSGCAHTQADVDLWSADLDAAIELIDPDQLTVFKGTFSMGPLVDLDLMQGVWDAAAVYVDAGQARWATVAEMQAAYED